jgi:autotransporter-associated beta strand protein
MIPTIHRLRPGPTTLAGLLLLTLSTAPADSRAAEIFVSPSGNDAGDGSMSAPFLTIEKALLLAQPGDSVKLHAGTYREAINPPRSGTALSPIVIEAYNGEQVTVSALDLVPGPWTSVGNGIYTAIAPGSLPVQFWNPQSPSAGGSQFVEIGGNLVGTIVNEANSTTKTITSATSSGAWNFFPQVVTWKARELSIASTGTTALPGANSYLWFSIMSPLTSAAGASTSAYVSDDAATVRFAGNGKISLYLKKNTANSLGTEVHTLTDTNITGFDLTMGAVSGGNVPYTFIVKRSTGGDTTFTGNWAITQADWNDGGDGSTSHLQIFAQENATPTPNPAQKFQFTIGSYSVTAGAATILRDEFDDNQPATVDEFPSGLNATVTSGYDQVFVDGVMQHEARTPNHGAGGLLSPATAAVTVSRDTDATNNTVTSTTFGGKPANFYANARFTGAVGGAWSWQNAVVTNSAGNVLKFDLATKSTPWWPGSESWQSKTGIGFVYGLLNLLDADGEWYLAPASSVLSLRIAAGGDPTGRQVEIKRRNWCVNINGLDYITVRGIKTVGGAIKLNGVGNVLSYCDASYLSHFLNFSNGYQRDGGTTHGGGVVLGGSNCIVQNSTIHDTAGPGIYTTGTGHLITRTTIYNANYAGIFTGGLVLGGDREVAVFNIIYDCGRDVVNLLGTTQTLMFNELYNSGKLCKDLGVVYSANLNSLGTRIAYNWIHDGSLGDPNSNGIYLDNYDRNFQVDHNVIWNFGDGSVNHGIYLNSPADAIQLYHNTLFNCTSYNLGSYNKYPNGNPDAVYWTGGNQHLIYTAQNNLVLSDSGASLENIAAKDFRPKAGTPAIDPPPTSGVTTWTTPNGTANVPATFDYNKGDWTGAFTYTETIGQGLILPGVNGWVADGKADSGAYERGIAAWTAGIDGWEGLKQDAPPVVGATTATLQCVRVALDTNATQVRVYYGTTDGGTNTGSWSNASDLGTAVPNDVLSVFRPALTGLGPTTTYHARIRATSDSGDSWSDATSFTTGIIQTPTIMTPPTASVIVLGQPLNSVTLIGGSASVPGSFAWTDPGHVPALGASSQSVTFTPTDTANYTAATATINVTVSPMVTKTWTGGGSGANWNSGANWDGAAPIPGSDLIFSGTNQPATTNDFAAGTMFNSISFTNATAGSTGFTLSGNNITLGGNIVSAATNAGSGQITETMILGLILNGDRTVDLADRHNLNYGTTVNPAVISSTGVFGLTKEGLGTFLVRGSVNTFTGNFTINAGTVQVGASTGNATIGNSNVGGALGAGRVINLGATSGTANATLTYGSSISDSTDRTIILGDTSGSKTIQTSGTGNLTLNGTITRGTNNLELGAGNALSTLRVESQLGGSGVLTKTGDGTLTLTSATSDFTGEIRVNGGTLEFTSIAHIGVASSLGNGSATSIRVGNAANSGTLNYVGDGDATDRQIRIGAGNGLGNATVNNNGANGGTGLQFTNASFNVSTANATAGSRTLTLGGTNTDANTIAGRITNNSGAGAVVNLVKADSSRWILSGSNTYTGPTQINGGILVFAKTIAKAPGTTITVAAAGSVGLGVGAVSGDYSNANVASLFNSNALSGFNLNAASGVALDSSAGNFTQSTALTAARALTKLGANTLILSGSHSYSGSTSINAGTLSLSGAYLANAANVAITSRATLNLNFSGTDTIGKLLIDGVEQYQGTWGSLASGATYKTARITGSGILNVTAGPLSAYDNWAVANGLDNNPGKEAGPAADPDRDGIPNLFEWVLSSSPLAGSAASLPQGSTDATSLSLNFTRHDAAETNTTLFAQWSADLATWTDVLIGAISSGPDANGVTVTVAENAAAPDSISVRLPRSNGPLGRLFIRLKAAGPRQ